MRLIRSRHAICVAASLAACDEPAADLAPREAATVHPDPELDCVVPAGLHLLPSGRIVADDIAVGTRDELQAACAAGRPFPLVEAGRRGIGTVSTYDLWPDGIVPYEVDDELPLPTRVDSAIAQWETATSLVFVERTTESDYVRFTNGVSCNSPMGRQLGRQDIELSTAKTVRQILGTGISPAGDVYAWYDDGMVSAGSSTDLDSARAQYPYDLPPGYTVLDVVAIAIANDGDVYTWFDDGRRSIGSTRDLDEQAGPTPYLVPAGKTPYDIVEIDIAVDSDVYTWYDDRTVSIGTSTDLAAHDGPVSVTLPAYRFATDIVGVAIANDGDVYTWFDTTQVSIGTSTVLNAHAEPAPFALPVDCDVPAVVHEIGHAVGLYHEQSHPDRDDHVRVFDENILPDEDHNFCVVGVDCPWGDTVFRSSAYDVTSRMHYRSDAFAVPGTVTLLQRATPGDSVSASDVIDLSISPAGDVYTWWTDGTVTSGTSDDLELHRARTPFVAPRDPSEIVGILIAKGTGDTYTFYADQTRSIGSTTDLASISGPVGYGLPPGYTASDILAVDHAPNGRTYAWYDDGRVSSGISTDLDAYTPPTNYSVAALRSRTHLLGVAISAAGTTYAWYSWGDASAGSTTDFDTVRPLYDFASRGLELAPSPTLTAGDVAQVEGMYGP